MSIAVLTDIHGNFEAFQTCIQYALARGVKTFWFLGDYLGEFAFPQRTMKLIYELKQSHDCIFIRGNKEDYWLNYHERGEHGWKEFNSTTGSLYYTYHNLTAKDLDFFSAMEIAKEVKIEGMEPVTICHGSPYAAKQGLHPGKKDTFDVMEQSSTRLILCGHTHVQRKIEYNGKTVINPGAVGVPRCSCGKTQFLILHEAGKKWKEEFISLAYDAEKEIENLHEARLDERAPYWCRITEHLLRGGRYAHAEIIGKAMEYCKQENGICVWPDIPERFWERAYSHYFGKEDLQSCQGKLNPEKEAFPVCLQSTEIYKSTWMTLYSDRVQMPDGSVIDTYHRVHIPRESVCVIIVNEKKEILLIQSKRYITGRLEWEIPAGRMEAGECAEGAAKRECTEETGCESEELHYMCSQNSDNGISDMLIHYYIAKVKSEGNEFDKNEVQSKRWVTKEEAAIMLRNNGTRCGVSMFGLLYAMQFYME